MKETNELSNNIGKMSKRLRFCGGLKSNPCTFYYSDHPDAPQFKTSIHKNQQKNVMEEIHDTQPTSCEDLQNIGHNLEGFYVVRFNSIKLRIVFCDFRNTVKREMTKVKNIKATCHGLGSQPCHCHYSKTSNVLQYELSTDEITRNALILNGTGPTGCDDLKFVGHNQTGFYTVRASPKTIKSVFCDFKEEIETTRSTLKPTTKVMALTFKQNTKSKGRDLENQKNI